MLGNIQETSIAQYQSLRESHRDLAKSGRPRRSGEYLTMRIFAATKHVETLRVRRFEARVSIDRCLVAIDNKHRGIDATIDIIDTAGNK